MYLPIALPAIVADALATASWRWQTGEIQNVCLPNALLTLQEYLLDYADEETRSVGEKVIAEQLASSRTTSATQPP